MTNLCKQAKNEVTCFIGPTFENAVIPVESVVYNDCSIWYV